MATKSGVGDLKEADLKGIGPVDNNLTFKNTAGLGDRDSFSIVRDAIFHQRIMLGYKTSGVYERVYGGMTIQELVDYEKAKCKGGPLMLPYDSNIIYRTCLEEPLVDEEEAWARQLKAEAGAVAPKVVNLIHALVHQNKDTNVNVPVQMTPHLHRVFHIHNKRLSREGSSQPPISFSDDDLEGLDLPHDDALVIALKVGDCLVDKILVDSGSDCEVMYFPLFKKLGLKAEDLKETHSVLSGFNEQDVHPMGVVTLPILAGSLTVQTDFLVVDLSSAYNAIVGRRWLHKMKAVPSSYHQKLKFQTEKGIEEIRGDQNASKECCMIAAKPKIAPASGIANDGCNMGLDSGPMAVFDFDKFAEETEIDAKELEDLGGKGVTTTITGGDSVAAVEKVGLVEKMSHISTGSGGGRASFELLERY